jgi:hypothetical protein
MRSAGFKARLVIAVVASATVLVMAAFIVRWRTEAPSAAALRLKQIFEQRPAVNDADNALFDVWGFSAPAGIEPRDRGRQRVAWLERTNVDAAHAGEDPGEETIKFKAGRTEAMQRVISACRSEEARACRDAFVRMPPEMPLRAVEALQVARYRAMLERPAWREIVPLDVRSPLPAYADVLDGQRMLMLSLREAVARADAEQIRATLASDLKFWRATQQSADILITKMIAIVAIRQNFRYGNLLLRELPAPRQAQAIPETWRVEVSPAERSMLRVMAGELAYFEGAINTAWANADEESDGDEDFADTGFADRLIDRVPRLVSVQYHVNRTAKLYLAIGEGYEVPLTQYAATTARLKKLFPHKNTRWKPENYALRVGSIEGIRRAALLTATLRARGVPAADVAGELGAAGLRNPFDDTPFEWDANEQAVVYTGPEEHQMRRTEFIY